ncbi:hypothetical protein Peur_065713 [Populus x canadensis]
MASFKCFILTFFIALAISNINVAQAARRLLQLPPLPSLPNLPKPTLPPLPTIPSLPQPTLPTLPTTQPSLPKPTLPPLPSLPTMPSVPKFPGVGERNGKEGVVVGIGGSDGMLGGGGKVSFGTVDMVGKLGSGGNKGLDRDGRVVGKVGNVGLGRLGTEGAADATLLDHA